MIKHFLSRLQQNVRRQKYQIEKRFLIDKTEKSLEEILILKIWLRFNF